MATRIWKPRNGSTDLADMTNYEYVTPFPALPDFNLAAVRRQTIRQALMGHKTLAESAKRLGITVHELALQVRLYRHPEHGGWLTSFFQNVKL